jgi:hypothetical protein
MEMRSRTAASPEIREFAKRLVIYEAAGDSPPGTDLPAEVRVAEKLRQPLSRLAGVSGFRALLVRALTLAKAQAPGLVSVKVNPDGSLEGLGESGNRAQDSETGVILIAELLGLLAAFVGGAFTFRLVLDVWPGFPVLDKEPWRKNDHDGPG